MRQRQRYMVDELVPRKRLSRLIHSVQHIPAVTKSRSRLDTNSLWNLVGELESFSPLEPTNSLHFTQTSGRKCFSKKYLNLRLYPSSDRSSSPDFKPSTIISQKSDGWNNNKEEVKTPKKCYASEKANISKRKDSQRPQTGERVKSGSFRESSKSSEQNKIFSNNKTDGHKKKNQIVKNSERNQKSKGREKNQSQDYNFARNTANHEAYFENRPLKNIGPQKKYFVPRKVSGTPSFKGEKNLEALRSPIHVSRQSKCKVLDKIKNIKTTPQRSKFSQQRHQIIKDVHENELHDARHCDDRSSIVKKLTSYWNGMLSSELYSSDLETSDQYSKTQSLENLNMRFYQMLDSNLNRSMKKSCNVSKSDLNMFEKLENLSSGPNSADGSNEMLNEPYETKIKNEFPNFSLKRELENLSEEKFSTENSSLNSSTEHIVHSLQASGDACSNRIEEKDCCVEGPESVHGSKHGCTFKTENAVDVLKKLTHKLELFPDTDLVSEGICLPRSLKAMLCVMITTVMALPEEAFVESVESFSHQECKVDTKISSEVDQSLLTLMPGLLSAANENCKVSKDPKSNINFFMDECDGKKVRPSVLSLVPSRRVTCEQFNEALRNLNLLKDYLWTKFVSDELSFTSSNQPFTFVFEGEFYVNDIFSGGMDGSDFEEDECALDSRRTNICTLSKRLHDAMENVVQVIIDNWPNDFKEIVSVFYHALVSILIWWVIVKEVFRE